DGIGCRHAALFAVQSDNGGRSTGVDEADEVSPALGTRPLTARSRGRWVESATMVPTALRGTRIHARDTCAVHAPIGPCATRGVGRLADRGAGRRPTGP